MLNIFANIFGYFVNRKNQKYDANNIKQLRCSVPVISIGNLSVGGTGKTPFTIFLSNYLKNNGHKPCVIGRGYKRKTKGMVVVSDGNRIFFSPEESGDEMFLIAHKCKVPVVVNHSKANAAVFAEKKFDIDCIIIDDGFQHRRLWRDLDIVLIDKQTLDKPHLLPKGRLREPFSSLKRADIVCLTKGATISKFNELYSHKADIIDAKSTFELPSLLQKDKFHELSNNEIKQLQNKIIAVAGIANPNDFFDMLKSHNYNIIKLLAYDDHHKYNATDIANWIFIAKKYNCMNLLTTEKDIVKILPFNDVIAQAGLNIYSYPIATVVSSGFEMFEDKISQLFMNNYS